MNVYDEHPFRVILDYAHNPDGIRNLSELASKLEVSGKRIVVITGPGDRRDEDLVEIAIAAAGHFDQYICKADDSRRGREFDEVPKIIAAALIKNGVPKDNIHIVPDEVEAIDTALKLAEPDDLLMIFGDSITRCWKQIINFNSGTTTSKAKNETDNPSITSILDDTAPDPFVLESGMKLVKDERGVRVVSEFDEQSD